MKRVITADFVASEHEAGRRVLVAPRGKVVVTPDAWSRARELGVTIDECLPGGRPAAPGTQPPRGTEPERAPPGTCERAIDASGVVVVRGRSVELGRFEGAGPGREVGLLDVVGSRDRSPMTAGFMSWRREDSFPWTLDYDEIDLVLEGVLHVTIDGRVVEGRAGDVVYIPKGSRITFGTPNRVRVFYVTYPADWSTPARLPPRPQK